MKNKTSSSDRKPVYLSPEERVRYAELAKNYRTVAGMKLGSEAVTAYEKSAHYYELIRDHATANEMRQFADWIRGGGSNKAMTYERVAKLHENSGRHSLAQKIRDNAEIVRKGNRLSGQSHSNSFVASVISVGLLGGLFFLYSGISGKVIAGIENNTSNIVGVVLVLIAIGLGVFYILRKKRRK